MGAGGGGPGGPGGGRQRAQAEGPVTRTIYVVDKEKSTPGKPMVKPVRIKTGIADTTFTEVLEGLSDSDVIVTGINNPILAATPATTPQGRSPFGGGGGFGGGRGPR